MKTKLSFLIIAILSVVFWRVIPHPPNVTPVMATALFCGCYFNDKKVALLMPLLAMIVADFMIGFHGSMLFVYTGIAITVFAGIWLYRRVSIINVFVTTIACSVVFFILTNFGAWLVAEAMYPKTLEGLLQAYIAGIPFYRNSLLGDLFFVALLFGAYQAFSARKIRFVNQAGN